jgi:uncharacterized protein (TIGR02466 family)
MKKKLILPEVIFEFQLDENICTTLLEDVSKLEWTPNQHNFYSKNSLNKDPTYDFLHEWFHECLQAVKNDLQMQCEELNVVLSWATKTENGQFHNSHTHRNSVVSGILYLQDNMSHTWFSRAHMWGKGHNLSLFPNDETEMQHEEETSKGKLLIFPSMLPHRVSCNSDDDARYTIAFNAFPSGQLGDYSCLNSLHLKKMT